MNSVNSDLRDRILLRAHYVSRFENTQKQSLLETLQLAHSEIVTKIAATGGEWTKAWLNEMLKEVDGIYATAVKSMGADLTGNLKDLAEIEAEWAAKTLDKGIPLNVSISTPAPTQVWSAVITSPVDRGHLLSELLDGFEASTVDRIRTAIRQGVVEGETSDQMIRRIRGTTVKPARWIADENGKRVLRPGVYTGGVMDISTRAAQNLVSTAVMHVSNVARNATFRDNSDILNGVQFVATLDTLTCEECAALDGTTYENPEDAPQPPLHLGPCRCTLVPIVKSWKELGFDVEEVPEGTRASMDGQVPESMTYGSWLKSQSTEVQNDALGPGRAALFRDGMSIDRFVKDGRVIPLADLQ